MSKTTPPAAPAGRCENCGTELHGRFCHRCGQPDFEFRRSFGTVLAELLETFFNFDGKLGRGLYALLFRPGRLTADFLAGKRVSQVPPLRFYIFISVLYFLASSWSDDEQVNFSIQGPAAPPAPAAAASSSAFQEALRRGAARPGEINALVREHLPTVFLAGVPVLAFLGWGLFRRSRLTYLQHLVVAVHLQTFTFLLALTAAGWGRLGELLWEPFRPAARLAALGYLFGYVFVALRRVYGETVAGTAWRMATAMVAYLVVLLCGVALIVLAAFLQM